MTVPGVVFRPQLPPERLRPAADEAGLDELWLWEDCFLESGIAAASAALAWTSRLRVGVGLLPVPLRNVALTAMEVATLERLFPGRLKIGVGHGVQDWMAQVGAKVASPVTLLREHLEASRALLRGETVTAKGRYVALEDVALDWPPAQAPGILAGAVGPRTLRLSGGCADGTIIVAGTTPQRLRAAVSLVEEGRRPHRTAPGHGLPPRRCRSRRGATSFGRDGPLRLPRPAGLRGRGHGRGGRLGGAPLRGGGRHDGGAAAHRRRPRP